MIKVKTNLNLDKQIVRDLDDLRKHFNLDDLLAVYHDKRLHRWLAQRGLQAELTRLEALATDTDDTTIALGLCGIFEVEIAEAEIRAMIAPLALQKQQQQRLDGLAQQQFKREAVIADYHAGYEQLRKDILAHANDALFLTAAVKTLKASYPALFRANFAAFFEPSLPDLEKSATFILQRLTKPVYVKQSYEYEMVFIKGGSFLMGSPGSEAERGDDERQHPVTVADFEMAKYPVTQAQWQAVMGSNPSHFKGADLPVENVSWLDAQEFIEKLNQKTGQSYRLPTEAEWEYACRAGTSTPFYTGTTVSTGQANYDGNFVYGNGNKGRYLEKTTPVGSYPANPWGLYDMMGNVWEWTASLYVENYDGSENKFSSKNDATSRRVLRGGSWGDRPEGLRSAVRVWSTPGVRDYGLGVRLSRM